jgi:hypothetical protein
MGWIDQTQDRDHWRALVNTVIHFGFHTLGSSWAVEQLLASPEWLSSLKLIK